MERLDQIEPWRAATDRQLYYWVGVDSGRAISFAKKSGPLYRLPPASPDESPPPAPEVSIDCWR
jgi:hypothetical protein